MDTHTNHGILNYYYFHYTHNVFVYTGFVLYQILSMSKIYDFTLSISHERSWKIGILIRYIYTIICTTVNKAGKLAFGFYNKSNVF